MNNTAPLETIIYVLRTDSTVKGLNDLKRALKEKPWKHYHEALAFINILETECPDFVTYYKDGIEIPTR